MNDQTSPSGLRRQLGLLGLAATGICSMLGASIYVLPFMIQRNAPGFSDQSFARILTISHWCETSEVQCAG